jgi:hypothetical protein
MTWESDVSLACRLLVGTVFAVSAMAKLRSRGTWRSYSSWLAGLPLKPLRGHAAPALLSGADVAVVVLVAIPVSPPIGLAAGAAMSMALTLGLATAVRRGSRQPCHCFGSSSEPLSALHVVRNALLLVLAATGVACAIAGARAPAPGPAEAALAVVGGLTAALLIIFFGDVAALLRPTPRPVPE